MKNKRMIIRINKPLLDELNGRLGRTCVALIASCEVLPPGQKVFRVADIEFEWRDKPLVEGKTVSAVLIAELLEKRANGNSDKAYW